MIKGLARIQGCPYFLPNPETRKPYDDIKRAWDTARKEARLDGLRIHDLRHSAASFMINAGVDLYAVGKISVMPITSPRCVTAIWPTTRCWPPWRPVH